MTQGEHKTKAESSQLCYIKANLTEDSYIDYIYFTACFKDEQAKEAAKTDNYNLAVWLYATICGEVDGSKPEITEELNTVIIIPKLIKPFIEIIK